MFGLGFLPLIGGFLKAMFAPLLDPSVWPGLALVAFIAFGYGWWKGDAHGDRQCEQRIARDKAEQEKIIREAGEETIKATDRWLAEQAKLTDLEGELANESRKAQEALDAQRKEFENALAKATDGKPVVIRPPAGCGGTDLMLRQNRIKGRPARPR